MRFSLQQMVQKTLAEAEEREKLAQEAEEEASEGSAAKKEEKGKPPAKTPTENTATSPERNENTMMSAEGEKTSSAFVEKLASAVSFCNEHFFKGAAAPESSPMGPDKGPNPMPTNAESPTPGTQSTNTGQASHDQVPMRPGSDVKSPGQTNPATAMETDMNAPPGGHEDWSKGTGPMKQAAAVRQLWQNRTKTASPKVSRVQAIMNKMAEDATSPAQIKATHNDVPPLATQSEEGVPSLPGEASKQESMIMSADKAIDYTKQQAKAVPKARMGEVLNEPAQRKSTDPVLHENLDATSGAGVKLSSVEKVAAARALLRKIAQEGEAENASPEQKERANKLQEALKAKKEEKSETPAHENAEGAGHEQAEGEKTSGLPIQGGY
jgi:hypothetical protein